MQTGAAGVSGQTAQLHEDTAFFGHPRGLSTLFFTEFWERWGYYGMRSLLILFMTAAAAQGGLGFSDAKAAAIYGLFTASAYLASLPGGWIADRILGQRKAVLVGGAMISAGYLMLAIPIEELFFLGLVVVVAGTGLLKPNISTIVGQIYKPGDPRRDAGFSIFYMGINMGAFFAPLACGWVARSVSWRAGLAVAGVGMVLGLAQYLYGYRYLGEAGLRPVRLSPGEDQKQRAILRWVLVASAVLVAVLAAAQGSGLVLITAESLNNAAGVVLFLVTVGLFVWLFFAMRWTPEERKRIAVIAVLFLASTLFWSAFEQAGSTLNFFAARSTDNRIFGWEYPPSWLQSLNGLFIWTLAPVFAWMWLKLGDREPSSPAKFAWGLVLLGAGYVVLMFGAQQAASGAKVSPLWLTATYFLHTLGELCLSPVGLSAITKLAPERVAGLMMGVWFLSISAGNYLGGKVAGFYASLSLPTLFLTIGLFAIGAGVILALFVRPIVRLMGGVK
ncbi:MAG: peptide MFS transporter [Bryobacteraceae bacterium]|nr:peptide MFS transporter [Bryobacteraceae bacterium]MDW8379275.1 peptide MFS transporter [Bryobacterales bacterium]